MANYRKIDISDFDFKFKGYGRYEVTYTSPVTYKTWTAETTNMPLIDATRNADNPKQVDLRELKRIVKNNK